MPVTEVYQGPGSFSVQMATETPELMSTIHRGGYLIITDQRLGDPRQFTDASLRAAAKYEGVVLDPIWQDRILTIEGASTDWIFGDLDGVGWPIPARSYSSAAIATVFALIASGGIIPPAFTIGSTVTGSGNFTGSWTAGETTCKAGLMEVMTQIGNHYKIEGGEVNTERVTDGNLYRWTPKVIFRRDNYGDDVLWVAAPVTNLKSINSIREWLDDSDIDIYGPNNTLLEREDTNDPTHTRDISGTEQQIHEVRTPWRFIDGASVGDRVYVWDPASGFEGGTVIQHRAEWIKPDIMRILEATWNITEGMGVYYRPQGALVTIDDWIQLTDTVAYEPADSLTYLRGQKEIIGIGGT